MATIDSNLFDVPCIAPLQASQLWLGPGKLSIRKIVLCAMDQAPLTVHRLYPPYNDDNDDDDSGRDNVAMISELYIAIKFITQIQIKVNHENIKQEGYDNGSDHITANIIPFKSRYLPQEPLICPSIESYLCRGLITAPMQCP
jgi:hypothetical protein